MKTALITGANGFVGSNLTKFLVSKNVKVYALVQANTNYENIMNLNNVTIIPFELSKILLVKGKLPKCIDTLFHLAWGGVSTTYKNIEDVQLQNIQYSLDMLRMAKAVEVGKVICAGSISEYAYNDGEVNGYNVPSPADFYSASKVATHYLCDIFARQNDINFIWTLISSIYGPGRNDNNLITYAIKSFLKSERPSFTKLKQKWDYIYIDDLVDAFYHIGCSGNAGVVYPIGSGENKELSFYVSTIRDLIDKTLPIGLGELPYKTSKIDNSIVDIDRLKNDTGFIPNYSFTDGITKTIEYFRKNM